MTGATKKFFYGWVVVFVGFLLCGVSTGIYYNCTAIFVNPVTTALKFSRGEFMLSASIMLLLAIPLYPTYGSLVKKYPMRNLVFVCAVFTSLGVFLYSFATVLWHFYAIAALIGIFLPGLQYLIITTLVNSWFIRQKGLAIGLAASGAGVMGAFMVPVVTFVVKNYGWQWGYRTMGVVGFLLSLLALSLMREKPEDMGLSALGAETQGGASAAGTVRHGLTLKEAVKTPSFYLLVFAVFGTSLVSTGIQPHIITYFTDQGYSLTLASAVMSFFLMGILAGKPVLGIIFDKAGTIYGGLISGLVLFLTAASLLMLGASPLMPWIFAGLFSFGYATMTIPNPYLTSTIFGNKDYPGIFSLTSMGANIGGAVGGALSGFIFDMTGTYQSAWIAYSIFGLVIGVCFVGAVVLGKSNLAKEGKQWC